MSHDVAIAGAGLAGTALAVALARAGARVVLLDPGKFPRDKLCGEYLSPEGGASLERLGLGEALEGVAAETIRRVRITTPRGRAIESEVAGLDGRPGLGLSRSTLDRLLVEHARSAGAEVLEATRVVGPIFENGRVVGLDARDGRNAPMAIRARVAVAADGRHSALVRKTGTTRPVSRFRPRHVGLKRHLAGGLDEPGTVSLHLIPGGYVGTCRVEGGMTNLCGLVPESRLKRHRGDLDRFARDAFPTNPALGEIWSGGEPLGAWKTVAGVRVERSRPDVAGLFYVGDAHGTVDPLGGQGMTMALLGAELLAPFVLDAVRGGGADRALQERHGRAWRRRFSRRIHLCRLLHHILVHPALLDVGSMAPPLARRLAAAAFRLTRDP